MNYAFSCIPHGAGTVTAGSEQEAKATAFVALGFCDDMTYEYDDMTYEYDDDLDVCDVCGKLWENCTCSGFDPTDDYIDPESGESLEDITPIPDDRRRRQ